MRFTVSNTWRETFPDAAVGFLVVRNANNPETHPDLDARKTDLEASLRARFSGMDRTALETIPPLPVYSAYYKHFKKTYHVYLQLESIVLKGKSIPDVAGLVEAMFMAELKNMLLTAGHDLDMVQPPVRLDISTGEEHYTGLKGQDQVLKPGDMYIADTEGIISNIIYGPDRRTQISPATSNALFTTYGPPGISAQAIELHLHEIYENILTFSPTAAVDSLTVIAAVK